MAVEPRGDLGAPGLLTRARPSVGPPAPRRPDYARTAEELLSEMDDDLAGVSVTLASELAATAAAARGLNRASAAGQTVELPGADDPDDEALANAAEHGPAHLKSIPHAHRPELSKDELQRRQRQRDHETLQALMESQHAARAKKAQTTRSKTHLDAINKHIRLQNQRFAKAREADELMTLALTLAADDVDLFGETSKPETAEERQRQPLGDAGAKVLVGGKPLRHRARGRKGLPAAARQTQLSAGRKKRVVALDPLMPRKRTPAPSEADGDAEDEYDMDFGDDDADGYGDDFEEDAAAAPAATPPMPVDKRVEELKVKVKEEEARLKASADAAAAATRRRAAARKWMKEKKRRDREERLKQEGQEKEKENRRRQTIENIEKRRRSMRVRKRGADALAKRPPWQNIVEEAAEQAPRRRGRRPDRRARQSKDSDGWQSGRSRKPASATVSIRASRETLESSPPPAPTEPEQDAVDLVMQPEEAAEFPVVSQPQLSTSPTFAKRAEEKALESPYIALMSSTELRPVVPERDSMDMDIAVGINLRGSEPTLDDIHIEPLTDADEDAPEQSDDAGEVLREGYEQDEIEEDDGEFPSYAEPDFDLPGLAKGLGSKPPTRLSGVLEDLKRMQEHIEVVAAQMAPVMERQAAEKAAEEAEGEPVQVNVGMHGGLAAWVDTVRKTVAARITMVQEEAKEVEAPVQAEEAAAEPRESTVVQLKQDDVVPELTVEQRITAELEAELASERGGNFSSRAERLEYEIRQDLNSAENSVAASPKPASSLEQPGTKQQEGKSLPSATLDVGGPVEGDAPPSTVDIAIFKDDEATVERIFKVQGRIDFEEGLFDSLSGRRHAKLAPEDKEPGPAPSAMSFTTDAHESEMVVPDLPRYDETAAKPGSREPTIRESIKTLLDVEEELEDFDVDTIVRNVEDTISKRAEDILAAAGGRAMMPDVPRQPVARAEVLEEEAKLVAQTTMANKRRSNQAPRAAVPNTYRRKRARDDKRSVIGLVAKSILDEGRKAKAEALRAEMAVDEEANDDYSMDTFEDGDADVSGARDASVRGMATGPDDPILTGDDSEPPVDMYVGPDSFAPAQHASAGSGQPYVVSDTRMDEDDEVFERRQFWDTLLQERMQDLADATGDKRLSPEALQNQLLAEMDLQEALFEHQMQLEKLVQTQEQQRIQLTYAEEVRKAEELVVQAEKIGVMQEEALVKALEDQQAQMGKEYEEAMLQQAKLFEDHANSLSLNLVATQERERFLLQHQLQLQKEKDMLLNRPGAGAGAAPPPRYADAPMPTPPPPPDVTSLAAEMGIPPPAKSASSVASSYDADFESVSASQSKYSGKQRPNFTSPELSRVGSDAYSADDFESLSEVSDGRSLSRSRGRTRTPKPAASASVPYDRDLEASVDVGTEFVSEERLEEVVEFKRRLNASRREQERLLDLRKQKIARRRNEKEAFFRNRIKNLERRGKSGKGSEKRAKAIKQCKQKLRQVRDEHEEALTQLHMEKWNLKVSCYKQLREFAQLSGKARQNGSVSGDSKVNLEASGGTAYSTEFESEFEASARNLDDLNSDGERVVYANPYRAVTNDVAVATEEAAVAGAAAAAATRAQEAATSMSDCEVAFQLGKSGASFAEDMDVSKSRTSVASLETAGSSKARASGLTGSASSLVVTRSGDIGERELSAIRHDRSQSPLSNVSRPGGLEAMAAELENSKVEDLEESIERHRLLNETLGLGLERRQKEIEQLELKLKLAEERRVLAQSGRNMADEASRLDAAIGSLKNNLDSINAGQELFTGEGSGWRYGGGDEFRLSGSNAPLVGLSGEGSLGMDFEGMEGAGAGGEPVENPQAVGKDLLGWIEAGTEAPDEEELEVLNDSFASGDEGADDSDVIYERVRQRERDDEVHEAAVRIQSRVRVRNAHVRAEARRQVLHRQADDAEVAGEAEIFLAEASTGGGAGSVDSFDSFDEGAPRLPENIDEELARVKDDALAEEVEIGAGVYAAAQEEIIEEAEAALLDSCATRIQAVHRGRSARRTHAERAAEMEEDIVIEGESEDDEDIVIEGESEDELEFEFGAGRSGGDMEGAAGSIQAAFRGRKGRKRVQRVREEQAAAARRAEETARAEQLVREAETKREGAALAIQRRARGMRGRGLARRRSLEVEVEQEVAQQGAAALKIQRQYRGARGRAVARQRSLEEIHGNQSAYRGRQGRQQAAAVRMAREADRREGAGVLLQREEEVRGALAMDLQRVYRGRRGRQQAAAVRMAREADRREGAAVLLQRHARGVLGRARVAETRDRQEMEAKSQASVDLLADWDFVEAAAIPDATADAAKGIQRRFRGYRTRARLREQERAVTRIQSRVRGGRSRASVEELRAQLANEEAEAQAAAEAAAAAAIDLLADFDYVEDARGPDFAVSDEEDASVDAVTDRIFDNLLQEALREGLLLRRQRVSAPSEAESDPGSVSSLLAEADMDRPQGEAKDAAEAEEELEREEDSPLTAENLKKAEEKAEAAVAEAAAAVEEAAVKDAMEEQLETSLDLSGDSGEEGGAAPPSLLGDLPPLNNTFAQRVNLVDVASSPSSPDDYDDEYSFDDFEPLSPGEKEAEAKATETTPPAPPPPDAFDWQKAVTDFVDELLVAADLAPVMAALRAPPAMAVRSFAEEEPEEGSLIPLEVFLAIEEDRGLRSGEEDDVGAMHRHAVFDAVNEVIRDLHRDQYLHRDLGRLPAVRHLKRRQLLQNLTEEALRTHIAASVRGELCAYGSVFATEAEDMAGFGVEDDEDWFPPEETARTFKMRLADDIFEELLSDAVREMRDNHERHHVRTVHSMAGERTAS